MGQERRAVITTGASYVGMGIIDRKYLPDPLFPPPPVVYDPPPTIDQMVATAQSRLRFFINAECDWLSMHIRKEFAIAIILQSLEHRLRMKSSHLRQTNQVVTDYRVYSRNDLVKLLNLKEDQHD